MTNLTLLYKLLNLSSDLQAATEHATECEDLETADHLRDCGEIIAKAVGEVITQRGGTARKLVDAALATKSGAM